MNSKELASLLDGNYITISSLLLKNKEMLGINSDEVIFISYLMNKKNVTFDVKKISAELGIDTKVLMQMVSNLQELGLLKIKLIDKKEVIDLTDFYEQWAGALVSCKIENTSNIFEQFESEFGRTLSPIEFEIINNWREQRIPEDLIILALKEAVFNGVNNLRYIDKIIHEWQKKGISSVKAAKENQKKYTKEKATPSEMFDYNWLEDK